MWGAAVLRVGGRRAYSTCSLNPVEDEAVVAAALALCGDAVRLVPTPPLGTARAFAPGLTTWKVGGPANFDHSVVSPTLVTSWRCMRTANTNASRVSFVSKLCAAHTRPKVFW